MNYYSILMTFGILVVLIPNLGFPGSWKIVMLSVLGITISILSYLASKKIPTSEEKMESVLPE